MVINVEAKKTKKELAKIIINKDIDKLSHDELIDLLLDENVAIDVDKESDKNRSYSENLADKVTTFIGTWKFIIIFSLILIAWVLVIIKFYNDGNTDSFMILNLFLSCVAALQAPIIMMSQNRDNQRERKRNQNDYKVDLKSELILEVLYDRMEEIMKNQKKIIAHIEKVESHTSDN